MNRVIAFGFCTFEPLIQKLRSAENAASLFKVYQENKDQFKHEHVVISLRLLGKFSREINQDNSFAEITSKLNEIVGELNEIDVVDVLFWLRKFKLNRIPINITTQTQNYIYEKVQQMSNNQMFSFRNMCNVYYELSILHQYNENLVKDISEQLLTCKQLSPFLITQLLRTAIIRINNCNLAKYDQTILTNSIKSIDSLFDTFDIEQKSYLLKVCAEIQFQNLPPKFSLPIQVKKIKDSLLHKIELLSEDSIINIFKAYEYLPKQFEFDLLRELRDKILSTLESNPQNLSDKFIVKISEKMIKIPHQRISQDNIKRVLNEFSKRISNNTIDVSLINYMMPILMKYRKIDDVILALEKLENKSLKILNYMFIHGVNVQESVNKFMQNREEKNIPFNQAINYLVYANRDANEYVETLFKVCKEHIDLNPLQALKTLYENELTFQIKFQLQEDAYFQVIELVKQQKYQFFKVFRELVSCCCNNKSRSAFLELYDQQDNKMSARQMVQRSIQDLETFNTESFSTLLQLLSKDPKGLPIQKFVDYLTLNQTRFLELIKSDQILWVMKLLVTAYSVQPEQKFYAIINFVCRFENIGYVSKQITGALKAISELYRKKNSNSIFPDHLFVNLLINHNVLTPQDAIIQLNQEKLYQSTKVLLCGIALQAENIPPHIIQLRDKIKEACFQALKKEVAYQPILELISLNGFSQEEIITIKTQIQILIPQLQAKYYFDLIMQAKDQQILKELASSFSEFSVKLGLNRVIRAAEKFAKYHIQNQLVYNALLESYSYSFFTIFNEQRIQVLEIFSLAKIKQSDLFKKTFERIKQQPQPFKIYLYDIIDMCYNLGFVEQEFVELITQITEKTTISGSTALKLLQYQFLADQPIQVLEQTAQLIHDTRYKDSLKTAMTYEILLRKYPNSEVVKVHQILLMEEKFSKARYQIANPNNKLNFSQEFCIQYIKILGVELETNKCVDGINVDFYIPEIEASILIVHQTLVNFDQITMNGYGLLQKKLLETITKQVIEINFKQLAQLQTHEDRAIHLMNLGIPIKVDITKVDYSSLRPYDKQEKDKANFQPTKSQLRKQFGKSDYLSDPLQIDQD